jgi:dipeptidase
MSPFPKVAANLVFTGRRKVSSSFQNRKCPRNDCLINKIARQGRIYCFWNTQHPRISVLKPAMYKQNHYRSTENGTHLPICSWSSKKELEGNDGCAKSQFKIRLCKRPCRRNELANLMISLRMYLAPSPIWIYGLCFFARVDQVVFTCVCFSLKGLSYTFCLQQQSEKNWSKTFWLWKAINGLLFSLFVRMFFWGENILLAFFWFVTNI